MGGGYKKVFKCLKTQAITFWSFTKMALIHGSLAAQNMRETEWTVPEGSA